jgi:hypothetical protein
LRPSLASCAAGLYFNKEEPACALLVLLVEGKQREEEEEGAEEGASEEVVGRACLCTWGPGVQRQVVEPFRPTPLSVPFPSPEPLRP